ncbi:hypothetical protein WDZ92_46685, partial [Nostoc sp. NIES-2111]
MAVIDDVLARIDADRDAALERLFAFLRIESISTDPAYAGACREAAEWLAQDLRSIGFANAAPHATSLHPVVSGRADGRSDRRVLFYGHYDVQPVDPLEEW